MQFGREPEVINGICVCFAPEYRDWSRRFRLAVNDPKSPPDLRHSYINLEVGYEYTILIEVSETKTLDSVEKLPILKRNCKLVHPQKSFCSEFDNQQ